MKKLILIAAALLPCMVSAQKLLKPYIDKISNDTTWSASEEKLYFHGNFLMAQGEAVTFRVIRFSNTSGAVLVLNPQSLNMGEELSIAKNQKVYLKFSDNTMLTLASSTDDNGTSKYTIMANNPAQSSSASGYYDLTGSDMEKLRSKTLVFLRIETSAGNFDCVIKPKNAAKLTREIMLIGTVK